MALPPPIPLKLVDRPETWAEYDHRRRITALWRQVGDFVTNSQLNEFLFATYRGGIPVFADQSIRRVSLPLPLGTVLGDGAEQRQDQVMETWPREPMLEPTSECPTDGAPAAQRQQRQPTQAELSEALRTKKMSWRARAVRWTY